MHTMTQQPFPTSTQQLVYRHTKTQQYFLSFNSSSPALYAKHERRIEVRVS